MRRTEVHGLVSKHRDPVVGCVFPLFLLKSAEAATLRAVICIISGVQQKCKAGPGQGEALPVRVGPRASGESSREHAGP